MNVIALQLAQSEDPFKWVPVAALALGAAYLFIFRPMRQKRDKDPMEPGPSRAALSQQRHVEREMQNLLVELSEMSRKITAQLDTRTTKLEMMIHEADEKIAQLRAMSTAASQTPADRFRADAAPSQPVYATQPHSYAEPPTNPRHTEVYTLADQGRTPAEIADGLHRPRGEIELILALRGK